MIDKTLNKYYVELDGISIISTNKKVKGGDALKLCELGDTYFYRVRDAENKNLQLRLLKTVEHVEDGIEYLLVGNPVFFENRVSKNQNVIIDGVLRKVNSIDKKSKELDLLKLDTIRASVIYGVYESRSGDGLTIRDREKGNYFAKRYFESYREALIYVGEEREKGRKVSL